MFTMQHIGKLREEAESVEKQTTAKSGYWGVYNNGNGIIARVQDPISGERKHILRCNGTSRADLEACARAYGRKMLEWHGR